MAKVHALRTANSARSPEREALAAAIADYHTRVRELEAVEEAIREARSALYVARRDSERAEAAVNEAKETAAQNLTSAMLKQEVKKGPSIKEARAAALEAVDVVDVANATLDALQNRQIALTERDQIEFSKRKVDGAVQTVLRAEVDGEAIYRCFVAAYREFADARKLLQLAEGMGLFSGEVKSHSPEPRTFEHPSADAFVAATEALAENPDAPLPSLRG